MIIAVPLCPSLVAVTVAVPGATPVTSPVVDTVATFGLLVAHVTRRPVTTLPPASFVIAVSCTVAPPFTVAVGGATVTEATGTGVPVAAKVTGGSPVTVAVKAFAPGVLPNVQLPTVAIPLAFVVWEAPVMLPPPELTAKVTATPGIGFWN